MLIIYLQIPEDKGLKKMCEERGLTYIDVYPALKSKDSEKLNPALRMACILTVTDIWFGRRF